MTAAPAGVDADPRLFLGALTVGALDLLDAFLFFGIRNATGIVMTYYLVSRRLRFLATRPLVYGPVYGVIVYAVMHGVVVPLSAAAPGVPSLPVLINGLLIHAVGVGIPTAAFVHVAARPARAQDSVPGHA